MVSNGYNRSAYASRQTMNVSPAAETIQPGSCKELMEAIMEADFYMTDLKLYLDTHPKDMKALEMYREAVRQYKACKAAFEDSFYPITASGAGENGKWDWLDGNFPPLS